MSIATTITRPTRSSATVARGGISTATVSRPTRSSATVARGGISTATVSRPTRSSATISRAPDYRLVLNSSDSLRFLTSEGYRILVTRS